jgi:hypothetical protein
MQQIKSLETKLDSANVHLQSEKETWKINLQNLEESWRCNMSIFNLRIFSPASSSYGFLCPHKMHMIKLRIKFVLGMIN